MFTSQMAPRESSHPSSERAIIHLDEDRPHKISILMAPNYPEQGPAKPKAPVSFRNLKQDKSRRILGLQHARLVTVHVFVLITDATIKGGLHHCMSLSLSHPGWPRSKVTADAVSTSWMSFRSSSSIHLGYKRKPRVCLSGAPGGRRSRHLLSCCLCGCDCWEARGLCVCYCDLSRLKLTCLLKSSSDCVEYRSHGHVRL